MTRRKLSPGFYWVRFEGKVIVAERINNYECYQGQHWHIPGCLPCYKDREICELLSKRLEEPKEKRK